MPDGGFTVCWCFYGQDGDGYGVLGQRYGANAEKIGEEFRINQATANEQEFPEISADKFENILVSYQSRISGQGADIF